MEEREFNLVFERICNQVTEFFKSSSCVNPHLIIYPSKTEKPLFVFFDETTNKAVLQKATTQICKMVSAIAGAFIAETRMSFKKLSEKEKEKFKNWEGKYDPEQDPTKLQVLIVSLHSRLWTKTRTWKIIEDGEKRSLEEFELLKDKPFVSRYFEEYFQVS